MKEIILEGQVIQLLPERAAFWSEKRFLIIADLHLGKASTMQHAGIPVPEGTMERDLQNLSKLIKKTKAEKCIVIGDLIHAKAGLSNRVQQQFKAWLLEIDCPIELIIGNHDRALLKILPEGWNFIVHQEELIIESFCFTHIPKFSEEYFVWSGHIHPQFLVKNHFDQLRLRCFHVSEHQIILPAFSDFVGGAYVKKTANSQVFVIADDEVISI